MARIKTTTVNPQAPLLDSRLSSPRFIRYAYRLPEFDSRVVAEKRARQIRRRILIAAGLCPTPKRTPLKARIFDRMELDGCTVEKVCFESRPGFLVTGNLFRPMGRRVRSPAVLSAHGHWSQGRFSRGDACGAPGSSAAELVDVPGRCAMLASLGFVVLSYDMVGYGDSCQLGHWPSRETTKRSLLYGIGTFGLQLWNSMRAVDFLSALPDVDSQRIGCTGASGGATQTYFLAAVDTRIKVTVPVCMVAAHFQGGCGCEEPPLLHLDDLSTLDVAAALAPRPMLLASVTGDWTNQTPQVELPALRRVYALFGAAERVANVHIDATHNYGRATREHMYAWFVRWLAGEKSIGRRIRERKMDLPSGEAMALFPNRKLPRGLKTDQALLDALAKEESAAWARRPTSPAALRSLRAKWRSVYQDVFNVSEPRQPVSVGAPQGCGRGPDFEVCARRIGRYGHGEQIPALWIVPKVAVRGLGALVIHERGKSALFQRNRPGPLLGALLDAGIRVLAIDMLGSGETADLLTAEHLDRDDPLFYAFNKSLACLRAEEALIATAALRQHDGVRCPTIIGVGTAAVTVLLARPLLRQPVCAVADLTGIVTEDDSFWMGPMYHPMIRKVGGLAGALALGPPTPLMLAGAEPATSAWARAVYQHGNDRKHLKVCRSELRPEDVATWIHRHASERPQRGR